MRNEHLTPSDAPPSLHHRGGIALPAETTTARYVIRYRFDGVPLALLVEDSAGDAYVIGTAGRICPLAGTRDLSGLEPALRRLGWLPVPRVDPYRLDELQRLLAPRRGQ
jgi:hypothetical protein